jgi:hypothetical protein
VEELGIGCTYLYTSSTCLLHTPSSKPTRPTPSRQALFSGDHLSGAEDVDSHWKMDGRLFVFTEVGRPVHAHYLHACCLGGRAGRGLAFWEHSTAVPFLLPPLDAPLHPPLPPTHPPSSSKRTNQPNPTPAQPNFKPLTQFNWYSVDEQLRSVQKLLDHDWLHVLPGHGAPARLRDAAERLKSVSEMAAREGTKERPARVW